MQNWQRANDVRDRGCGWFILKDYPENSSRFSTLTIVKFTSTVQVVYSARLGKSLGYSLAGVEDGPIPGSGVARLLNQWKWV